MPKTVFEDIHLNVTKTHTDDGTFKYIFNFGQIILLINNFDVMHKQ